MPKLGLDEQKPDIRLAWWGNPAMDGDAQIADLTFEFADATIALPTSRSVLERIQRQQARGDHGATSVHGYAER